MTKPTRSMPNIDQEQGDSMDEGDGHEEWLSDGGYTDDDTFTSQDQDVTSSQDEQSILQDTTIDTPEPTNDKNKKPVQKKTTQESIEDKIDQESQPMQVEETVENINNQLQLEINIGEDGVAIIRRQAVRVATSIEEKSPQKVTSPTKPAAKPSVYSGTTKPTAANSTTSAESTADDDSVEDPEKLLDQLETFLIRKTDGKVLETKATVQTTLTDLVKKTVDDQDEDDEGSDKNNEGDDDGNDTDDLLSVLDDSVSRRTTRSLAKLQQADTPSTKGKTSVLAAKQVKKPAESPAPTTPQRRTSRQTSSASSKPVILSNKVVQLSNKTPSHKKSNSNQKSSNTKSDKISTKAIKDNVLSSPKADEELIKYFASKNPENPPHLLSKAIVKVERTEIKKPTMKISNSNFGDTYTSFIQKQSVANKSFGDRQKSNTKKSETPKVYKRKARVLKDSKEDEIDPFDKLFQSDDESDQKSAKIKKVCLESAVKSPITKKADISDSTSKITKSIIKDSPKVANKANEHTNNILSILEKKTGLSVKSTTQGSNKIQSITRKAVTELPKTQSPKIQTTKFQSPKIQTTKVQIPIIQTTKVQSPIIQSTKVQSPKIQTIKVQSPIIQTAKVQSPIIQTAKVQSPIIQTTKMQSPNVLTPKMQSPSVMNDSPRILKRALTDVSTKNRPVSPVGKKFLSQNQTVLGKYSNLGVNKNQNVKSHENKAKVVDKKEMPNKNKMKDDFLSDDDHMDSEMDDHDMSSMPEWPGDDDDDEDEEEQEKPSEPQQRPQRLQEGGILKKGDPIRAKCLDNVMIDGSTEFDSEDIEDSDFEDMSASESEGMEDDLFTIDLRDERAAEYLPLLGEKAEAMLEQEKRSLLQKLSTIRQSLKSLQDNTKKNHNEVEMAKLKIMELNTLLRQP